MFRMTCMVLGCCLALNACDGTTITTTMAMEREWQAVLTGEAEWEHVSGASVVTFTEGTTSFLAVASIAGDEPGAARPWHVHFNTCAQGGGIVGQDGDYPRLTVGADGTAEVSVTVNQTLQAGVAYHVNVHRSDDDLATIIACGDLMLVN